MSRYLESTIFRTSKFSIATCVAVLGFVVGPLALLSAQSGNRLNYLDDPTNPYYVHQDFPKLTTPQWMGEEGVDAVIVLAIDDMNDSAKYENYLRPILDRLKAIDNRAPVSIMTNRIDPQDPQLQSWLKEGLSLEVHTWDHPCPCLANSHFAAALETYHKCVDVMASIPHNRPVAFRMPCCDSMNTPSPRFYAEIFNRPTTAGNFLTIDSSVFQVFTSTDSALPRDAVVRPDGRPRFEHYIPFPNFANKIENYPYPYLIGSTCWQIPCMVPSDWEAQHVQAPNNPETVRDMKIALDLAVLKQGTLSLVFHPHGWIRNEQIVELIDHAVTRYGKRVKFMTFAEVNERMERVLLRGNSLRAPNGGDNGVRLIDLNNDGYLDVVVGNSKEKLTRVWLQEERRWKDLAFPLCLVDKAFGAPRGRFGVMLDDTGTGEGEGETDRRSGQRHSEGSLELVGGESAQQAGGAVVLVADAEDGPMAWRFHQDTWVHDKLFLEELPKDGTSLVQVDGRDLGLRLRDFDGDGQCELLQSRPGDNRVWRWNQRKARWVLAEFQLPNGVHLVDEDGRDAGLRFVDVDSDGIDDVLFSNAQQYRLQLARFSNDWRFVGWPVTAQAATRSEGNNIPPIVRDGPLDGAINNGVWFAKRTMWAQNEDTAILPDKVDRRPFDDLLGDLAAIPAPRSPQQSLLAMTTRADMQIDLVASEPMVADPVAFDWGPDGRMWVVEMRDYPSGMDGQGQPGGRVRVLTDTDGDGRYDQSQIFLDQIPFPTGVKVWRTGILVTAAPEIFYAEDTDGDGVADHRETLYRGFVEGNQQHRVNGLQWGLDNWLHIANGDSGGMVTSLKTGQAIPIGGRDLKIKPDTGELMAESGMTQYGRTADDWGHWFGCNNTYPIWHYVLSDSDLQRNPHFVPREIRNHVSVTPGAAPVFPTSRTLPRFNDFHMVDRFTSACGLAIYRDRWLGESFVGNYFVCEPVHNLVQREVMTRSGVTFQSQRAADEQDREFLSSADHWFRPVMARTGPDGALWIADMYRLVIEHPEWIPAQWQAKLDLRAGDNMGRIYRVFPKSDSVRSMPRLDRMSQAELVMALESDNGWVRDMAQQMLIWNADAATPELLARLMQESTRPLARLHALATLQGIGRLSDATLGLGLKDAESGVRQLAFRLSGERLSTSSVLRETAIQQVKQETELPVLFSATLAMGDTDREDFARAVMKQVADQLADTYLQQAAISSIHARNLPALMEGLLSDWQPSPDSNLEAGRRELWSSLLRYTVASGNQELFQSFVQVLLPADDDPAGTGLAAAVKQRLQQDPAGNLWRIQALTELLNGVKDGEVTNWKPEFIARLEQIFVLVDKLVADDEPIVAEQVALAELLGRVKWNPSAAQQRLRQWLSPQTAPEVRSATVRSLARFDDEMVVEYYLEQWSSHSPTLRHEILDVIFSRNHWIKSFLQAVQDGRIPRSHLDATRRQQLVQHRTNSVRQLAGEVLAASVQSNRQTVIDEYAAPQENVADVDRGRVVFRQHCASCHQLEGVGYRVGPDLAAFMDKSDQGLLTAILDPNRAIEDRYQEYLVLGTDGRQHRGMISSETSNSLTLLGQEGKTVELLRNEIEEMAASGLSLMPEGLEKDVTPTAMADLLKYLRSSVPPHKVFPGNEPDYPFVRDDGSIRLLATNARIYGPTLVFEQPYRNLGFWGSAEDRAVWSIRVPKAGRYEITLDYACANEAAGNRFVIQVAGQSVGGVVPGTGSWDEYSWHDVGFVQLEEGEHELTFRSEGPFEGFLLDLRSVILAP
ncbi:MAG: VCBS repeat-containing protein [Planctomycetaceae bacterium]|nr:VCBS repeat-containing protein [Planctomycetaceae bacterium]